MSNAISWRPYQIECKSKIKDHYQKGIFKQLIVQATGTGKRLASIDLMNHFNRALFIAHREELILQAYRDIEMMFPFQVGIVKGPAFEIDKKIVVASVQTLFNRLDRIDPDMFDLVIVDECFPAGTLVDGRKIEEYKPGDYVTSYNHDTLKTETRKVTNVSKKIHNGCLYDFGSFKCTPNHPIYIVGIGYAIAKDIYYAYIVHKVMSYVIPTIIQKGLYRMWKELRNLYQSINLFSGMRKNTKDQTQKRTPYHDLYHLWEGIRMGEFGENPQGIHRSSKKRIWKLFRKMQKGTFQESFFSNDEQYKSEICIETDEGEQSDEQSRDSRENAGIFEGPDFSGAWRKRRTNKPTTYHFGINTTGNGIPDINIRAYHTRRKRSELLQTRPGLPGSKIGNRNRWKNSPFEALEILRQKEDGSIAITGLDCNKIYKQRSGSGCSKSGQNNYVYNLEVEENNNYFAEGILVHNCHHYMSRTYIQTVQHFRPKLLTGWTATPNRLDGLNLSNLFEEVVFTYSIADGIKDGYLAKLDAYRIQTMGDLTGVKRTGGDFNQKQLSEAVDTELRNNLIVHKYKEYAEGRQAIAFAVDMDHAYNLRRQFLDYGISCETVVSDTERCPNRSEIIERFSKGEIDVLTNVNILTEGFDVHDVGCVLMARPTQSETLYVQAVGRGTRLKSDSFKQKHNAENCIILDFVDNCGKHSLVNAHELDKGLPIEDRVFLPQEHKDKLIEAREERERRIAKVRTDIRQDSKIDLLQIPKFYMGDWRAEKREEDATEKQIEFLKRLGIYVEGIAYTKFQASEAISNQQCSAAQMRKLAAMRYDISEGCTIGQFQKIMQSLEPRKERDYSMSAEQVMQAVRNAQGK